MRILIVSSEFPPGPGGIGTHAYELARQLWCCGVDISVVTVQDNAPPEEIAAFNRDQPFLITRLMRPWPTFLGKVAYRWRVLQQHLRDWQPDVIVASGQRIVWQMSWMMLTKPVSWVAIGHGKEFGIREGWSAILTRKAFNQAPVVVCVSEYTQRQMFLMGIHPKCARIIPNGGNSETFVMLPESEILAFRRRQQLDDARIILTVGSISQRKGHDIIIQGMPHILEQDPDAHYVVVGKPLDANGVAWLERLKDMCSRLGIADHIRFVGEVNQKELVKWFNACDLFAMTSRHSPDGDFEGYGIAVVEAALCRKPAVVSGNSGLAEAIVDRETGLLVQPEDPRATAEAIVDLLMDSQKRLWMGQAARERAFREQTWERRAVSYLQLLRAVMQNGESVPDQWR